MYYKTYYHSPLGKILLVSDEQNLIGLWIEGQKYFLHGLEQELIRNDEIKVLKRTKEWLNRYFKGGKPNINELPIAPMGSEFRQNVWKILCEIPYGETTTYGEIAKKMAKIMNKKSMSAQAVGNAVGHNPISIIIPCHRVIGSNGDLTGYAGGIEKKVQLLKLEHANMDKIIINKNKGEEYEKK